MPLWRVSCLASKERSLVAESINPLKQGFQRQSAPYYTPTAPSAHIDRADVV